MHRCAFYSFISQLVIPLTCTETQQHWILGIIKFILFQNHQRLTLGASNNAFWIFIDLLISYSLNHGYSVYISSIKLQNWIMWLSNQLTAWIFSFFFIILNTWDHRDLGSSFYMGSRDSNPNHQTWHIKPFYPLNYWLCN